MKTDETKFATVLLKPGTVVHIAGLPVEITGGTLLGLTHENNAAIIRSHLEEADAAKKQQRD